MQPRTLQQILSELNPVYEPQLNSLRTQQGLIPGQIQSQEGALNAKKDVAYGDIVDQARRRGVGFAGIPMGEQAKYAATDYAPALANLHTAGTQQATSLEDAINGVNERRATFAQQLYAGDQDRYAQQLDAERQRQASAASNAGLQALFGGGASGAAPQAASDADHAYQQVQKFLSSGRNAAVSDYAATLRSANNGNAFDKLKIAAYQKAGIGQQDLAQYFTNMANGGARPDANFGSALHQTGSQTRNLGTGLLSSLGGWAR